jgi:hypothetical protein
LKFYVGVNGEPVPVVVSMSESGNKYLKSQVDGKQPNNLLSLSECPEPPETTELPEAE